MSARRAFPVMGTMASVAVADADVDRLGLDRVDAAIGDARAELDRVEACFSHYRADSAIERWSAGADIDGHDQVEIELALAECARLSALSDGDFLIIDPRTGLLDTAGYVKGYAIDNAVAVLRDAGLTDFAIGVGGDTYCAGESSPGVPWRVAVQDPRERSGVVAIVEARDCAITTSGRSERGEHVWSRPGAERSELLSFTVIGPSIVEADAYATAGFAKGRDGMSWLSGQAGYRCIVVEADGAVTSTAALVSAA